jgi:hypothetical protein
MTVPPTGKLLTRDEARRIAANIAKLSILVLQQGMEPTPPETRRHGCHGSNA